MGDFLSLLRFGPDGWGDEIAGGAWLTIRLALATLPFGLLIGFAIALAKNSGHRPLIFAANAYTTVFRALPELLTIFLVYYGGQALLQSLVGLFSNAEVEVDGFVAGMVALALVNSAYSGEVFLGAFRAIGRGQYEGAYALGLAPGQTLRLVILPQLIRLALPGLANLWLILLKDTSLVSVIALSEILRMTAVAVGATRQPFAFYLLACLVYLIMSVASSLGIGAIERWSERGLKRA